MNEEYKPGELIIFHRAGELYEIGKIKSITSDGAFVWYHEGETAAKTPFECMHKLTNAFVVKETTLGGTGTSLKNNALGT